MKKVELLAPAGDLTRLKFALAYGADAVYIGGKTLSMRAKAKNFSREEMAEAVRFTHERGKKLYVAANVCAHNADFAEPGHSFAIDEYLLFLQNIGVDAVLISDVGVFSRAKIVAPELDIHVSTQANVTNFAAAEFWRDMGAKRVVLARELSLREIAEIRERTDIEIEVFAHGAMCMAYSGRCLISNFLTERDASRGECSQPCRYEYDLIERRSGIKFPVSQNERGTFIFNSKDLCMAEHLADLISAGVNCLKIEGRMKTEYYVGAVTKVYREAIDDFFASPEIYAEKIPHYRAELEKVGNRGYTSGFFFGPPGASDHDYTGKLQHTSQNFLAVVESYDEKTGLARIEQRNKFSVGDKIEIVRSNGENFSQIVTHMYDADTQISSAPHPMQKIHLRVERSVAELDMIRRPAF
ncbi:MAG: U32 family peptidase [Defluviitaleaceae bacterium]|nr:U32 family peptidase [Defluviitaleaceae bacterium]